MVQSASGEFLAGAGFALQEHRATGFGRLGDVFLEFPDGGRATDERGQVVGAGDAAAEPGRRGRDRRDESFGFAWPGQVVARPLAHALHGLVDARGLGDQDHRHGMGEGDEVVFGE